MKPAKNRANYTDLSAFGNQAVNIDRIICRLQIKRNSQDNFFIFFCLIDVEGEHRNSSVTVMEKLKKKMMRVKDNIY